MRRTLLFTIALGVAATGCGSATDSPLAVPATTTTVFPTSRTVPSFGAPTAVLEATAANAMANATGACTNFDFLYLEAAQAPVSAVQARKTLAMVTQFAEAAATGAPAQWAHLSNDVATVVNDVGTPAWDASTHQDDLAPVVALYTDCRPLE